MKSKFFLVIIPSLLIGIFCLLVWRLFYLQHVNTEVYRQRDQRQQSAIVSKRPQRGIIVDRHNRIIAASNIVETVFAEPRAFDDESAKAAALKLQDIIGIGAHKICEIIHTSKNPGYVKIKSGLTVSERDAIAAANLYGIGIDSSWVRQYPMGSLGCHVVGFAGVDGAGLDGLELKYDSELKGSPGRDVFVVDAFRKPIGLRGGDQNVMDGSGLILTIDASIQKFVRDALVKQVNAYNAESATGVVMNPYTGEVLAMVSIPDYSLQSYSKANDNQRRNRVLTDPFEPGSIFKPIVAAMALDSGMITKTEKFYCEKGNYHGKGFGQIGEWGNHRFEDLDVREILMESSNIGMAKIGQRMKAKRLYEGVRLFGFGSRTGIDLGGEDGGIVRDISKWDGYSITRVPYGHELMVTGLQIAKAYCILANGGGMVTPYLVKAVIDSEGNITKFPPSRNLAGRIIKPEVANWIVQKALVDVVKEGTGKEAALDDWVVFGKTGTANIAEAGVYDKRNYVASFAGGGPAEKPKVVVVVSIRKPDKSLGKGYSGGRVAAPVFKEIMGKTLTYLKQKQL